MSCHLRPISCMSVWLTFAQCHDTCRFFKIPHCTCAGIAFRPCIRPKIYQLTTVREGFIELPGICKLLFKTTFEQMTLQAAFRVSLHQVVPEQKIYQLMTVHEGFIQLTGIQQVAFQRCVQEHQLCPQLCHSTLLCLLSRIRITQICCLALIHQQLHCETTYVMPGLVMHLVWFWCMQGGQRGEMRSVVWMVDGGAARNMARACIIVGQSYGCQLAVSTDMARACMVTRFSYRCRCAASRDMA